MSHVVRLIYGPRTAPKRVLNLSAMSTDAPGGGYYYLTQDGCRFGPGKLNIQWTATNPRRSGRRRVGSSRENAEVRLRYDIHGASTAFIQHLQAQVMRFFLEAGLYEEDRQNDEVWLEMQTHNPVSGSQDDLLETLGPPRWGQFSKYYRVLAGEVDAWPENFMRNTLVAGYVDAVELTLTCGPELDGLPTVAAVASGDVSDGLYGTLVDSTGGLYLPITDELAGAAWTLGGWVSFVGGDMDASPDRTAFSYVTDGDGTGVGVRWDYATEKWVLERYSMVVPDADFPTVVGLLDDFDRADEGPPPSGDWFATTPSDYDYGLVVNGNEAATDTAAAFPFTGILDNFNRTDEGPPPSASWEIYFNNPITVDNQFGATAGTTSTNSALWGASFGADQEVYVTMAALPESNGGFGLLARVTESGQYELTYMPSSSQLILTMESSYWVLDDFAMLAGDKLGMRLVGSSIHILHYTGGMWVLLDTVTDSSFMTGGKIGAYVFAGTSPVAPSARLDDFGGGDYSPAPGAATWNTSFDYDQEVFATLATLPADESAVVIFARLQANSTMQYGYWLKYSRSTINGNKLIIGRDGSGQAGTELASASLTLAAGDKIGFRVLGSLLVGFADTGSGFEEVVRVTNTYYTDIGHYIGMAILDTGAARLDDFGGGEYIDPELAAVLTTIDRPSTDTYSNFSALLDMAHIAVTLSGAGTLMYIDGVLEATIADTSALADTGKLWLGTNPTGPTGAAFWLDGWKLWDDTALVAAAINQLYSEELPIKAQRITDTARKLTVSPLLFWKTNSGDGVLINKSDDPYYNSGIIGGVPGDVPASVEWRITLPTGAGTGIRVLWLGRKATTEALTDHNTLFFLDFSGTVVAGANGGEVAQDTLSGADSGDFTSSIAGNTDAFALRGRAQVLGVFKSNGEALSVYPYYYFASSNYSAVFDAITVPDLNSLRLYDFGDIFIDWPTDSPPDPIVLALHFSETSGGSTVQLDFLQLLPYPNCRVEVQAASMTLSAGDYLAIKDREAYIVTSSGGLRYRFEHRGEPVTVVPGQYNYIFALIGEEGEAVNLSHEMTVTPIITPKWLLPGGMA